MKEIKINHRDNAFFDPEIRRALDWLLRIRDEKKLGWAWVQLIAPNIQNTSEVICAMVELVAFLEEEEKSIIVESIKRWLLEPSQHAVGSIDWSWTLLALMRVKKCKDFSNSISTNDLNTAINECVDWLVKNQNTDGGYPDNPEEKSGTVRTSLAVWALSLVYHDGIEDYPEVERVLQNARKWLIDSQHNDGGWGNIRKRDADYLYQEKSHLTYADLLFQTESNPACTGYAMIALKNSPDKTENKTINKAYEYLVKSQKKDGSWDLFLEVGIRDGERYTFRHFSTTWALRGILSNEIVKYDDETIIFGFNYLAGLQDNNFGGWRCSADADNYTWATANAIVTINMVRQEFDNVKSKQFLAIIVEWWNLKRNDTNFSFHFKNMTFAFNNAMGLTFCIVFSLLILLMMYNGVNWISGMLIEVGERVSSLIAGIFIVIMSFILGVPWVIYVKNRFNKDMDSWINSIGWVYGIITGFVLAFYQLML